MSGREREVLVRGALSGALAYALGAGVVVGAGTTGLHPETGLWTRLDGLGYLLVHQASHAPVWQFRPQWAVLPFTLCVSVIQVGAGFVVARTGEGPGFQAGQAIVVGYIPLALSATVVLLATSGAVTAIRMAPLLLLVGVVVPVVLGGIGGALAVRYR
jgi:hypothetical protein